MPPAITLQPGEHEIFRETQRLYRNTIVAVLLPMEAVFMTVLMLALGYKASPADQTTLAIAWLVCAVVIPALLLTVGMQTVVTDRRLIVKWWPPVPGRDIPIDTVTSARAITYNPLGDAGGWGWKGSKKYHRVFNIAGDKGVHVRTGDDQQSQFLLGSLRTPDLTAAIETARKKP